MSQTFQTQYRTTYLVLSCSVPSPCQTHPQVAFGTRLGIGQRGRVSSYPTFGATLAWEITGQGGMKINKFCGTEDPSPDQSHTIYKTRNHPLTLTIFKKALTCAILYIYIYIYIYKNSRSGQCVLLTRIFLIKSYKYQEN